MSLMTFNMFVKSSIALIFVIGIPFFVNAEICFDKVCEYEMVLRWERTMVYRTETKGFEVEMKDGQMKIKSNSLRQNDEEIGDVVDPSRVITADGYERNIITINGQFPGPTLEVVKGSQVGTVLLPYHFMLNFF